MAGWQAGKWHLGGRHIRSVSNLPSYLPRYLVRKQLDPFDLGPWAGSRTARWAASLETAQKVGTCSWSIPVLLLGRLESRSPDHDLDLDLDLDRGEVRVPQTPT